MHLALAFDLLNQDVADPVLPEMQDFEPEIINPDANALQAILETVQAAQRPVILTGPQLNATRAPQIRDLGQALDAPVLAMESPRGLKDPCLGDIAATLARADVILVLGKQIDHTTGYGQPPTVSPDCKFLVVDPETEALERARRALGPRMLLGCRADAVATANTLIAQATAVASRSDWLAEVAAAISARAVEPEPVDNAAMRPAVLCAAVQRFLDKASEPLLIVDGGEFGQWAQALLSAKTRVINGVSGCIGGSLGYAIAAKIARPGATVVALMGDGTAGFHFSELETAQRYGINFIAVIGHDSAWNAEVQIQRREYGADRVYETELNPTRYDLAAIGFGCHGEHVRDPAELDAALERAAKANLPTCFVCEITGLPAPSGSGH